MNANSLKRQLGGQLRGIIRNGDPELAITSAAIAVAGRIYWSRLLEGGQFTTVQFQVTTASGNLCIAFAPNTGVGTAAAPGELVATTGSFACPGSGTTNVTGGANGDHSVALTAPASISAGDWVGIAADNTAAILRCTTGSGAVDTVLAAGSAWRETIAAGSPVIPAKRAALTPHFGRNWLILGV